MSSAYCYILYSPSLDKYYVGSTTDIARRVQEHNRGKDKFTRTGRPWTLVYREEFESLIEARGRERYIKRMKSRKFIEALIKASE
ncbi:MAG: GIY-YIG nuclease family protein [Bacteroidetes bacterium]|nr:MAG: GIY-YIG nuclease family protein [Bacteroidota bacterium]